MNTYIIIATSKNPMKEKMYFSNKNTDYWSMGMYYAIQFGSEKKALEMIESLKNSSLGSEVEDMKLQLETL
jgi:hypothetical protein